MVMEEKAGGSRQCTQRCYRRVEVRALVVAVAVVRKEGVEKINGQDYTNANMIQEDTGKGDHGNNSSGNVVEEGRRE